MKVNKYYMLAFASILVVGFSVNAMRKTTVATTKSPAQLAADKKRQADIVAAARKYSSARTTPASRGRTTSGRTPARATMPARTPSSRFATRPAGPFGAKKVAGKPGTSRHGARAPLHTPKPTTKQSGLPIKSLTETEALNLYAQVSKQVGAHLTTIVAKLKQAVTPELQAKIIKLIDQAKQARAQIKSPKGKAEVVKLDSAGEKAFKNQTAWSASLVEALEAWKK